MKFVKIAQKDEIGDIAAKHGVDRDTIESELEMGRKVEKEHADVLKTVNDILEGAGEDPWPAEDFFTAIAIAHLRELPDYYTRLKEMESKASS